MESKKREPCYNVNISVLRSLKPRKEELDTHKRGMYPSVSYEHMSKCQHMSKCLLTSSGFSVLQKQKNKKTNKQKKETLTYLKKKCMLTSQVLIWFDDIVYSTCRFLWMHHPIPKLSLARVTGLPFIYIYLTWDHPDPKTFGPTFKIKTVLNTDCLSWQVHGLQVSVLITFSHLCRAYCVPLEQGPFMTYWNTDAPFSSSCTKYWTLAWHLWRVYDILKNKMN